tara:strand:+ start:283 stop:1068 length:786 start_codon:yes stop_codon:yes gene_type:complete
MDFKKIKGNKHYLYDDKAEFMVDHPNVPIRHNWRHGEENEWVFTDDGFVCEILRKNVVMPKSGDPKTFVRTVCGTYVVERFDREMLGEDGIPENIYSLSGTNRSQDDYRERGHNSKEVLFARYVAAGTDIIQAYKMAFPDAKSEDYIKKKTNSLLKTEEISKMITKERRDLLNEEGVTDSWLIERYKTIADLAESDTCKLRSLDSLAKMSGLFDSDEKKSEKVEIWAGFSPEQLDEVTKHGKPKLIASAKRNKGEKAEETQ